VENVILELGLKDCATTKIGGENSHGISGGERRRVSIALQLLTDPSPFALSSSLHLLTLLLLTGRHAPAPIYLPDRRASTGRTHVRAGQFYRQQAHEHAARDCAPGVLV